MKFLLWALVLYLVWRWYQATQNKPEVESTSKQTDEFPSNASTEAEKMVSCMHCGIHVPLSEAIQVKSGMFFCSTEHQRQHTV